MNDLDREYYRVRAHVERERGDQTADPVVARSHHRLAELYDELLQSATGRPTLRIAV